MKYPTNQLEFEKMFKTEQSCIDYLIAIRWPHGFECPVCGSIRSWKKSNGRFECIDCHKETTVTNGTIFHKSTKPLLIWFNAIWWMVAQKNGVSAVVQHCLRNTHFVHNCTKKTFLYKEGYELEPEQEGYLAACRQFAIYIFRKRLVAKVLS